jgi:lipoprotein-anchoring transpeptidase ErfK/SrfK
MGLTKMKALFVALSAFVLFSAAAKADTDTADAGTVIVAKIDISEQRMMVFVNGWPRYSWAVSTARSGYRTPVGAYKAYRTEKMWYSRKYDMSPMPYSIFFKGGYAIHGTNYVKRLGTPASHGCVRLHTDNAKQLYALVREAGVATTPGIVTQ